MPVRDGSISADNTTDFDSREKMPRRYSDAMDDHVSTRNVRRRSDSSRTGRDRELRDRAVMNNGSRSSTRVRHRPEQYIPEWSMASTSTRGKLLRPRTDTHIQYLRELGRRDEVESGTGEDVGTEDDDHIFETAQRRRRKSMSSPEHSSPVNVSFQSRRSTRMANGHSSKMLDDSHELEGVRRSTRQRKLTYDNFNTSWIYGAQSVRGYRMPNRRVKEEEQSEEDEEVETGEESGEEREETGEGEESGDNDDGEEDGKKSEVKEAEGEESEPDKEETEQDKEEGAGKEAGDKENFEDMYSRVKRPRRKRIMFSEDCTTRTRSRSRKEESSDDPSTEEEQQRPQSPRRRSKYNFRQRKPKVQRFQIEEMRAEPLRRAAMSLLRSPMRRKRSRRPRFGRPSSSSSSSDSEYERKKARNRNMCLPVNYSAAEKSAGALQNIKSGSKVGTNLADTDPMELDPTVRFTHVGGLDDHIRCLKEMVVFPMLYPEIFDKFKVQPPKGVLFHGPPGTGKTLLARALANECSQGARRVAFFMRKGADCLSKWVGESERQLRLLFDQAYQMRPSIIFFDELDGLAPVRSCKQDQIHASIVSTLLALMDGLKNRGEVLLIGATNRIDAIDPALRRPGRFDRELFFPLPAAKERLEILNIHMSTWEQAPAPELVSHLSEVSSGYCGSDLKALCTEAVIQGLRRRYPQIYESSEKLLLDAGQVNVEKCDFQRAQLGIVPAAHRVACAPAHQLASLIKPLMEGTLTKVVNQLKNAFPHATMKSAVKCKLLPCPVPHPRMVLVGDDTQGQVAHLGPALLHHMEHVSVHSLELGSLFGTPSTSPEEVCVQLFREARRQLPAVVYIPEIDKWWSLVPQTVQALLTSRLTSVEPNTALLLFASSNCSYRDLPLEVQDLFSDYRGEVFPMTNPSKAEREEFFKPLFLVKSTLPPLNPQAKKTEVLEKLPVAPPPLPPKLTEEQSADIYKKEEMTLRELRIFLREICGKLARNKQFFMFVQPVDLEEAPDYLEIIKEPMDLETIMSKIDRHDYECAKDFLEDVNLICRNALEYNPDRSNQGKMIRHRACYLNDTAHALIKAEMDSDFEDLCKEISVNRKKRAFDANKLAPDFVYTAPANNKDSARQKDVPTGSGKAAGNDSHSTNNPDDEGPSKKQSQTPGSGSEPRQKKRRSPWSKGCLPRKRNKKTADESKDGTSPGTDGRNTPLDEENSDDEPLIKSPDKHPEVQGMRTPSPIEQELERIDEVEMAVAIDDKQLVVDGMRRLSSEAAEVQVDRGALEKLLTRTLDLTDSLPLSPLLDLHAQLARIITSHSSHTNRASLPQELEGEIDRFKRLVKPHFKK